jgi:hypothetical protein
LLGQKEKEANQNAVPYNAGQKSLQGPDFLRSHALSFISNALKRRIEKLKKITPHKLIQKGVQHKLYGNFSNHGKPWSTKK